MPLDQLPRRGPAPPGSARSSTPSSAALLAPEDARAAFEAAYARWYADRIMTEDPILGAFSAVRHADTIARFRAADDRGRRADAAVLRARLAGEVPAPTAFGADPEWGTLARELAKKARHQPLRQLFAAHPHRAHPAHALRDDEPAVDRAVPAGRTWRRSTW